MVYLPVRFPCLHFYLAHNRMSFWTASPGPSWWDCIESYNPCASFHYGLQNPLLADKPIEFPLPRGCTFVILQVKHANHIAELLKKEFQLFPRCRLVLSADRIAQGIQLEEWIFGGLFQQGELVACMVSKPLGRLKLSHEILPNAGMVDYFCVKETLRHQGLARSLLEQMVIATAKRGRLVHLFLKEGFPLWKIPPLWSSRYIVRAREPCGEARDYLGPMGIAKHSLIQSYTHADHMPLRNFIANLPYQLTDDHEIYSFNYRGHSVLMCMTDLHHRTVPDGKKVGELLWCIPTSMEVPLALQRLAVETLVDCSGFEYVLMDQMIPHSKKGWRKDASYHWYCFNYNPGSFFKCKPFFIY